MLFQFQYLLKDPIKYDVKYQVIPLDFILFLFKVVLNFRYYLQASAQPFLVLGILVTALANSH